MVCFVSILVFHKEQDNIHKDMRVSILHIFHQQRQVRILYRLESSWHYKHLDWIFSCILNMDMVMLHATFYEKFDGEFCGVEITIKAP